MNSARSRSWFHFLQRFSQCWNKFECNMLPIACVLWHQPMNQLCQSSALLINVEDKTSCNKRCLISASCCSKIVRQLARKIAHRNIPLRALLPDFKLWATDAWLDEFKLTIGNIRDYFTLQLSVLQQKKHLKHEPYVYHLFKSLGDIPFLQKPVNDEISLNLGCRGLEKWNKRKCLKFVYKGKHEFFEDTHTCLVSNAAFSYPPPPSNNKKLKMVAPTDHLN